MNTGEKAILSKNNLLTTIAWKIDDKVEYALEGSVFIAGAVVQWLRDGLKIIRKSAEVEKLAQQVQHTDGVYIVPAFAGLGAPHWNQYARGTIFGLTRGSSNAHIAKAALDSIAYQTYDVLKAMEADSGIQIKELRVDGGATVNNQLMQFQSDILNCKVVRPKITETTALGAAYLAGLAVGYWKNIDEIQQQWQIDKSFIPAMNDEKRNELVNGWQRAVKASIAWAEFLDANCSMLNTQQCHAGQQMFNARTEMNVEHWNHFIRNSENKRALNRQQMIQQLTTQPTWDICIIGGGATGLGTALDAASRGFKTILFEQHDFAKGTSSRSTKLVHGGVRYLQQGNIKLVMEALKERGLLMKNAPHLVHNQKFIVPNYKWWEGPFYGIGLKIYDWMAGKLGLGPSQFLIQRRNPCSCSYS